MKKQSNGKWPSVIFDIHEKKILERNEHNGCPACGCKDTGKWSTQGICGTTDYLYFCQNCGLLRMGL
jgi:hypothetical protein